MREKRILKPNMVIVCEGTDTEYLYFRDVATKILASADCRFGMIRVVPTPNEVKIMEQSRHAYKQRMRNDPKGATHPQWLYYVKEDHSQLEYDANCAQPARYVREAQLFMEDDVFTEGWAVYDQDVHAGHERALVLSESRPKVGVVYSGYSFEEWILCHFERNAHSYHRSLCKKKDCGINNSWCKGHDCLIGRIRQKHYIDGLDKNQPNLYADYLEARLETAMINAAWLRHVCKETVLYRMNPYTTVDSFMQYLLGMPVSYKWIELCQHFKLNDEEISVYIDGGDLVFEYYGNSVLPLNAQQLYYCDADGNPQMKLMSANKTLHAGCRSHRVTINKSFHYLRLEGDVRGHKKEVLFIELPFFS